MDLDRTLMRETRTLRSIKNKLVAFALLATLVPSVGLGLLSFWRYQAVLNDNVSHELRTLAADASGELKSWFRERVHELRTLSTAYTLSDGLSAGTEPRPGATRVGHARTGALPALRAGQARLDPGTHAVRCRRADGREQRAGARADRVAVDLAERRDHRGCGAGAAALGRRPRRPRR